MGVGVASGVGLGIGDGCGMLLGAGLSACVGAVAEGMSEAPVSGKSSAVRPRREAKKSTHHSKAREPGRFKREVRLARDGKSSKNESSGAGGVAGLRERLLRLSRGRF